MKVTRNIKKVLAFLLVVAISIGMTMPTFAAEKQVSIDAVNSMNSISRASHSVRFTYPDVSRVVLSDEFKYLEYTSRMVGFGNIKVTFTSGSRSYTFDLEPNTSGKITADIKPGTYNITVSAAGVGTSIDFFLWS